MIAVIALNFSTGGFPISCYLHCKVVGPIDREFTREHFSSAFHFRNLLSGWRLESFEERRQALLMHRTLFPFGKFIFGATSFSLVFGLLGALTYPVLLATGAAMLLCPLYFIRRDWIRVAIAHGWYPKVESELAIQEATDAARAAIAAAMPAINSSRDWKAMLENSTWERHERLDAAVKVIAARGALMDAEEFREFLHHLNGDAWSSFVRENHLLIVLQHLRSPDAEVARLAAQDLARRPVYNVQRCFEIRRHEGEELLDLLREYQGDFAAMIQARIRPVHATPR